MIFFFFHLSFCDYLYDMVLCFGGLCESRYREPEEMGGALLSQDTVSRRKSAAPSSRHAGSCFSFLLVGNSCMVDFF